jgi:transposase-like protein
MKNPFRIFIPDIVNKMRKDDERRVCPKCRSKKWQRDGDSYGIDCTPDNFTQMWQRFKCRDCGYTWSLPV